MLQGIAADCSDTCVGHAVARAIAYQGADFHFPRIQRHAVEGCFSFAHVAHSEFIPHHHAATRAGQRSHSQACCSQCFGVTHHR